MSKTVLKWVSLPKGFKRPPDSRSKSPSLMLATRVMLRLRQPKNTGSDWRSSNFQRRNEALSRLSRRWVVERSFAWTTRFRRLVRDYERLPATLAGLHLVVFACLMLHHWIALSRPEQSFRPPPSLLTKNETHPRNPVC